jgi:hypothetical protein
LSGSPQRVLIRNGLGRSLSGETLAAFVVLHSLHNASLHPGSSAAQPASHGEPWPAHSALVAVPRRSPC